MERITNEQKAKKIVLSKPFNNASSQDYAYKCAMQMAKWKDEQHKQELIRIYNFVSPYLTPEANNDLKIIIGIC